MMLFFSYCKNKNGILSQLLLTTMGGLGVLILFETGQKTLDYVDRFSGITDAVVDIHRNFSELSLYISVVLIFVNASALIFNFLKKDVYFNYAAKLIIIICSVLSYFSMRASYHGVLIRHTEVRASVQLGS